MARQEYTISHSASVLDPNGTNGAVTLEQNQNAPQRETPIATFECPENFDAINYVGKRDATRFAPRTMETFTGDGATKTFNLNADIQPVAGEPALEDQPYPAVVAVDVPNGEVDIASVDYAANSVTLASAPADTNDVKLYPIMTEGTLKFRGVNALGQVTGPVYPWSMPLYRWHDMKQDKRGTEVNLNGSITWDRNEQLEVMVDSPRQIVWEDADYPGAYVSTFEQDVEITF